MNPLCPPWVVLLFSVTTFVGAVLTFLMQPLVAKMLLPLFGGTPSVWNTCVLFFQAMLLAGYGYAHLLGSSARWRAWIVAHLLVMTLPLAVVPIEIGASHAPAAGGSPLLWQIGVLLATAGLPFFAVSATAPLVQRWLAGTGHQAGRDPYSLYAASNLGSLTALVAYPLAIEPVFDLAMTSRLWTGAYLMFLVLLAGCAASTLWAGRADRAALEPLPQPADRETPRSGVRWRWFALAFVPSSLMLSVTTHLSTNVASAPLLWVLPLAIYLVTYILAFARRRIFRAAALERFLPLIVLLLALVLATEGLEPPPWVLFPLHLGGLFLVSLACHGQMADLRPPVAWLTRYYFWVALGGLAGGVFNALVAPALFNGIVEYPVALVLACFLRRPPEGVERALPRSLRELLRSDALPAAAIGLAVLALAWLASTLGLGHGPAAMGLVLGAPVVACYLLLLRPVRFALALAALFLAANWGASRETRVIFARRTYYGLHRVSRDADWVRLYHGPTLHGVQNLAPDGRREPRAYYHPSGPAGSLFEVLEAQGRRLDRVAVVGAGVGSLAAYGRAGQAWTFYELDPAVASLAMDSGHFTFWSDSAAELSMVLGDARLSLVQHAAEPYDLIILDAFSSDAVPAHLLTREALQLYRSRLADGGLLVFHVSNRFLDLEAVIDGLARDAGWLGVSRADLASSVTDRETGRLPSHWVVLSTNAALIQAFQEAGLWRPLQSRGRGVLWTDRFSNLVGVFRWSG